MLVKPTRAGGSEAAEARLDAFMEALDDVPHWAVAIAIRKWHRGECGLSEHGKRYDYHWAPELADLRRLARIEACDVRARIEFLDRLLRAVPYRECAAELAHVRAAYLGLRMVRSETERLAALTFNEAAEIGARRLEQRKIEDHEACSSDPVAPKRPRRDTMRPEQRERLSADRKTGNEALRTQPASAPTGTTINHRDGEVASVDMQQQDYRDELRHGPMRSKP